MSERSTFGGELRRLRQEAGHSLPAFAKRIHYSKGYLSKIETGMVRPNESLARLCDVELGTGGALLALLPEPTTRRRRNGSSGGPAGLPPVTTHFTGRASEIENVLAASRGGGVNVCAINGMAGVGKTALAVWCAHRLEPGFADGSLFLDLRGHTPDAPEVTPAEALDRLLRLLGVPDERIPADTEDRAAVYRSTLRGRSMLIVLDNARSAGQVVPLLPGEPKCRVLITSRQRLTALDDAHHIGVDVLPMVDAVALFGALTGTTTESTSTESTVHSVVSRCGRLPLAIRIAASRLAASPAWDLADLDHRLKTEKGRLAELDDGERSVAAVFRLSLDNVPADQRMAFARVGLHPGTDLDVYGAAALTGLDVPATERLLALVRDAHLIDQQPSGRYRFHDLLRGLATKTAAELPAGERDEAIDRLLDTVLYTAFTADKLLAPGRYWPELNFTLAEELTPRLSDQDAAIAWFGVEWPGLVALCRLAGERGSLDHCWRLAFSLRSFFYLAKLWDPWVETQRVALAAAEAGGDVWAQAVTLNNLGVAMIDRGDLDAAADYYRRALAGYRELDDRHGVSTTLANYAWVEHYRGEHRQALQNLALARDFYRATGSERNLGITLRGMALVLTELRDYDEARATAERAMAIFDELGSDLDVAMTYNCLGWIDINSGQTADAEAAYREALLRSELCGSEFEAARAAMGLGNVAMTQGLRAEADQHWADAARRHVTLNPAMVGELRAMLAAE
jgi:tetratricopeptide (TPR) repeat protein/DNA-binding XRE family transcriptional regulator